MQLDLMEERTEDMLERWWGSFYVEGKPNPASSIPFPWFYRARSAIKNNSVVGILVEASSIDEARMKIELYMDVDLDDVQWNHELCDDQDSVSDIRMWWFENWDFDVKHMAKFGIEPKKKH